MADLNQLASQMTEILKANQELMMANQNMMVAQQKTNKELFKGQQAQIKSLQETVTQLGTVISTKVENSTGSFVPPDKLAALAKLIDTFVYEPANDLTFEAWYERYEDVFAVDANSLGDAGKVRLLLMKLETTANEQYRHSLLPALPAAKDFAWTVNTLKTMFAKKLSLFRTRWDCLQVRRKDDEAITAYGARVNKLAETFRLNELTGDQFKCLLFIQGIHDRKDKNIRTRLLNLFDKADPEKCLLRDMMEEAERILRIEMDTSLGTDLTPSVNQLQNQPYKQNKTRYRSAGREKTQSSSHNNNKHGNNAPHKSDPSSSLPRTPCWQCGNMHYVRDCRYSTHTCKTCKQVGHKEGYCNAPKNKRVNVVQVDEAALKLDSGTAVSLVKVNRKFVYIIVNGRSITLQFDSAADVTIISERVWRQIGSPAMQKNSEMPVDAQGNRLPILGRVSVLASLDGLEKQLTCLVSAAETNLFGIDWITQFNLWDRPMSTFCNQVSKSNQILSPTEVEQRVAQLRDEFAEVFEPTLGRCKDVLVRLELIEGAKDTFRPKRPVPFHAQKQVHEELERLEQSGIITPVPYSKFAAPIVVVAKANGGIRICGDYSTGLNANLKPHQYPIPTPDRIFASMGRSEWFTQIDLSDAYLQLEMDEDSRKLLTINTSKGLFTFNRLCPGVKPAAGIFQQTMETILAGIEDVIDYFDDILVVSRDLEGHQITIKKVFERLKEFNLRVRLDKCRFYQSEVKYLGIIINAQGQRPDPGKIEAIVSMPDPTNVAELRSLLGAITFYSRFVKAMSTIRAPLDNLLKKDKEFVWDTACASAFSQFKKILTSDLLLTHFDPQLTVTVASDASNYGIGSVAYHALPDGSLRAFHHVSRRLTDAEKKYSQPEKEALGIVFGITKFHQYIWGRRFHIITDHRPLLAIFGSGKGVPAHTSNRLQRWALILLAYDFDIQYLRTTEIGHADVLSRLIASARPEKEDFVIASIQRDQQLAEEFGRNLPICFETIGVATLQDEPMAQVLQFVTNGWPASANSIKSKEVHKYFVNREVLSRINDCLIYRDRTVVPPVHRRAVLNSLHQAHPGISRMKALARCFVYWPNMDQDITHLVGTCANCLANAKAPVKTLLASWPTPTGPWQRVHADFAGPMDNKSYLVLIDAYSKWPEVATMTATTAELTISRVKDVCARWGNMITLVTDNGPQFTSETFKRYCNEEHIDHVRTPPYHPQSNGQCERFVATLKSFLVKSLKTNDGLSQFLRTYRATPNESAPYGKSPAELLLGRRIRIPLSVVLPPTPVSTGEGNTAMEEAFNKKNGAKDRTFKAGETVQARIAPKAQWQRAEVLERKGKVIYAILLNGQVQRAHANQLRATIQEEQVDEGVLTDEPIAANPATTQPCSSARRRRRGVTRSSPPILRPRTNRS